MSEMEVEWDRSGDDGDIGHGVLLGAAFDSQSRMWIALVLQDDGSTVEIYPTLAKMRRAKVTFPGVVRIPVAGPGRSQKDGE